MMRHFGSGMIVILAAISFAGCNDASPLSTTDGELSGRLTLSGSSTVAPLATEIAKKFEVLHPDVRVDVQAGGSGRGIADARTGQADIGMASRGLTADEDDLTAHRIAADGVCLIVHRSNPIGELTADQVVAIYTDRVANWIEIGGPDVPIVVVHKAEGRATLEVFLEHFDLQGPGVKPDVIVGHNAQGIKSVAGSPGAIGYVSIGTAEADAESGVEIKLLPLGGVAATSENVASGEFRMSRPLNLVTHGTPSELAEAFIEYAQSGEVHDVVKQQYFVPLAR